MKDDLRARVRGLGSATRKGHEWVELLVARTHLTGPGIIFLISRVMSVKMLVENGKIYNKTMMGERL